MGVERGKVNYLLFLLTEDYIEQHKKIAEGLAPLWDGFADKIGGVATFVRPTRGREQSTLDDALTKGFTHDQEEQIRNSLPALLIIDIDYDEFDARLHKFLSISLRDSMDDTGDVKVFELKKLLDELLLGASANDLFAMAESYFKAQSRKSGAKAGWDMIEAKPGIYGFSLNLKKGVEFLSSLRKGKHNILSNQ